MEASTNNSDGYQAVSLSDTADGEGDEMEVTIRNSDSSYPPSSSASSSSVCCSALYGCALLLLGAAIGLAVSSSLSTLLQLPAWSPPSWSFLPLSLPQQPPPLTLPDALPQCQRTLLVDFGAMLGNGFGSRANSVLQAACSALREVDDRHLFIRDTGWNYQTFASYFLPPPDVAPTLPGWNDGCDRNVSIWQQLYWPPAFNTRSIQVVDSAAAGDAAPKHLVHDAELVDRYPSALYISASTAPSFAYPFTAPCLIPHPLDIEDQHGSEAMEISRTHPHKKARHGYAYAHPQLTQREEPMRFFTFPPDIRAHLRLSSPAQLANNRSLAVPSELYLLYNRMLHFLFVLKPALRQRAMDFFTSHGLRTRSAAIEAVRRRLEQQARDNTSSSSSSSPLSFPGIGSIACHVRRADKFTEARPISSVVYLQEVERIAFADRELYASFPALPAALAGRCGNHTRQVQVVLASDQLNITDEFRLLQPCFAYHTLPRPADFVARRDEGTMWSMGSVARVVTTEHFMVELVLMSEADYAVVTFSSNVGRLIGTSRGWLDMAWENRMRSLDNSFWTPK